jgi:DnaJ-class molecular chaperone
VCDNCSGTGKLGDGTVSVICPVCNGTGKRIQEPAVEPDEQGDDVSATEPTHVPAPPREECEVVPAGEAYTPLRRGLFGRWRRW